MYPGLGSSHAYIELVAFHILEIEGNGVFSRLGLVNVAYPVRGQIYLPILVVGKLVFPNRSGSVRIRIPVAQGFKCRRHLPLIQPHIVLHKEQVLIGKVRGPQSGGQIDVL